MSFAMGFGLTLAGVALGVFVSRVTQGRPTVSEVTLWRKNRRAMVRRKERYYS